MFSFYPIKASLKYIVFAGNLAAINSNPCVNHTKLSKIDTG